MRGLSQNRPKPLEHSRRMMPRLNLGGSANGILIICGNKEEREMRSIVRRLQRLEERWGLKERSETAVESWETRRLRSRLAEARHRCKFSPMSPQRAELVGRSIVEILNSGRRREHRC